MIHYRCPTCRSPLESRDSEAAQKVACPTCGQRMEVPRPAKTPLPVDRDDDLPVKRRGRSRSDDIDDLPTRGSRRRNRDPDCECPNCGSTEPPYERKEMAQEGWIVLVVLLLTFFPLFFLGLLMKQSYEICWDCGYKIRKVGGITFG